MESNTRIAAAMAYASSIDKDTKLDRFDIMKAYIEGGNVQEAMSACGQRTADTIPPVSIHYDEQGDPDGILVQSLDEAFVIALHDEFNGERVDYEKASTVSLPSLKQARLYGVYLKEINDLLDEVGGDRLEDGWYWTKTPAEELFGALSVTNQMIFHGTGGNLNLNSRISTYRVRVSLALNTKTLKP